MKGKERENSTFVYSSALEERGAEGTEGREGGEDGVVALGVFSPMAREKIKRTKLEVKGTAQ